LLNAELERGYIFVQHTGHLSTRRIGDVRYVTVFSHPRSNTRKERAAMMRPAKIHWREFGKTFPIAIRPFPP
jgi:hypothetical protein